MIDFWTSLGKALGRGQTAWLALVAAAGRHSPGTPGARLWVPIEDRDGPIHGTPSIHGTIGGGALEHRLVDRARRGGGDLPDFEVRTYHHRARAVASEGPRQVPAETSGLICAGWQTHVHLVCRPRRDLPTVEALVAWLESAATELPPQASSEAAPGKALWIDRHGLRLEPEAVDWNRPAMELVSTGEHLAEDEDEAAGTPDWCFRQQLVSTSRAAVIGAGHCGRAVAASLARCGWQALLFDPRQSVVLEAEQALGADPAGRRVRVLEVEDPVSVGERIPFPEITPVVVMTTDLEQDVRALLGTLPRPFPFVGVMGSGAKLAEIRRRLQAAGLDAETLARLVAPVGLPIASRTPEEIAVSVTGQLLAFGKARARSEVDSMAASGSGAEKSSCSPILPAPREVAVR